jgi:hypothetical protein
MATLDEIRLQQLLGTFEQQPQGIATLSQAASPLSFRYTDQLYPQYGTSDMGYAIGPYGNADTISGVPTYGYAIQPSATADSFLGSGFSGTTNMGYPFAPANRLGGLDLERFQGVSKLGRQDEDIEQVEYLTEQEPKGIGKLIEFLKNIPTPLNLLRKAFEGVGPGFIGPKGSRAYGDESLFSTFGRSRTGAEFFQNMRDRKARQEAAARGAAKQADQTRIDAFRAFRDSQPSGGGESGGIGSSYGGAASPGSKGPGGSDEWGSF